MKGFKEIKADTPKDISAIIWGSETRGKTHCALTFPGPIYHFNFDKPINDVLWAARKELGDKEIHTKDYVSKDIRGRPKASLSPEDAADMMEEFFCDFQEVMVKMDKGTLILDSISQIYKLLSKVELDKVEKAPKKYKQLFMKAYNDAGMRFQNLVKSNKKPGVNLVLIAQARDVYNAQDSKVPGMEEIAVNRMIPYLASVIVHIFFDEGGYRTFCVEKCTYRDGLRGKEYEELSYDSLMKEICG